jgi:hypothetical protein
VSFFTRVLIRETMSLLSWHAEEDILNFFSHLLTASYFCFALQFYEKIDSWIMGSLCLYFPSFCIEISRRWRYTGLYLRSSAGSVTWTTLSYLTTRNRQAEGLTEQYQPEHSLQHGIWKMWPPSLSWHRYSQKTQCSLDHKVKLILSILTST